MSGGDQTITISARAQLRADLADAFAFLAAPQNHRRLQIPGFRLLTLDDGKAGALAGGVFALDGPLGMRRIARTRVSLCQPPYRIAGSARLDSGTEAHVSWTLRAAAAGAVEIELTAVLGPVARADRVALSFGGRRWVRGRFARTLRRLAAELERDSATASGAGACSAAVSGVARGPALARPAAGPRVTQLT